MSELTLEEKSYFIQAQGRLTSIAMQMRDLEAERVQLRTMCAPILAKRCGVTAGTIHQLLGRSMPVTIMEVVGAVRENKENWSLICKVARNKNDGTPSAIVDRVTIKINQEDMP